MKFDDKYSSARPYTACFVILMRDNKIAMVLRKNTGWMDGYYGMPAGKLEYNETFTEGAIREAKEEAGVEIGPDQLRVVHVVHRHHINGNLFMDWVDIYFEAESWQGEPFNAEPEVSERLDWLDINNLPQNIVPEQKAALEYIKQGKSYSEYGWD